MTSTISCNFWFCILSQNLLFAIPNLSGTTRLVAGMVIEEESDRSPRMIATDGSARGQELLCSPGSTCIPLGECTVMAQLIQQSCLQTDKLRGLTCGYKGNEPLVCCPDTCPSPWTTEKAQFHGSCGQPQLYNYWNLKYKGVGSHPWAVRVGFTNKITNRIDYLCAGSIINKRVVLTAAHCALAKTATHQIACVRVGEYNVNSDPDCTLGICAKSSTDVPLSHIIVHPGYDEKTFRHNIALLVVKEAFTYSLSIQPICLYSKANNKNNFEGTRANLVGWGKLANQREASHIQQQLDLPVQKIEFCAAVYGSTVPITENELCVGGEAGRDACSGFGGAPLVVLDPKLKNRYFQIGLMSFGSEQCGELGVPSVYTRVDKYSDWIIANAPKL
ncbi:Tryp_SPc [Nesidiocoris tenuis]|uniref:CLIP domain-containing serine protease n=1 Tax=Nesidiocoris tenuis TaxID=355587 RepID=A0ABN7B5S1_9HEMI|nr:Tryp_SPc [Nesidiocoris tenuis]